MNWKYMSALRKNKDKPENKGKKLSILLFLDVYTVREQASPIAERVKNPPAMQETQEMWV